MSTERSDSNNSVSRKGKMGACGRVKPGHLLPPETGLEDRRATLGRDGPGTPGQDSEAPGMQFYGAVSAYGHVGALAEPHHSRPASFRASM